MSTYRIVEGKTNHGVRIFRVVEYQEVCLGGRGSFFQLKNARAFIQGEEQRNAKNALSEVPMEEADGGSRIRALEAEVLELRNLLQSKGLHIDTNATQEPKAS